MIVQCKMHLLELLLFISIQFTDIFIWSLLKYKMRKVKYTQVCKICVWNTHMEIGISYKN